MINTVIFDCFGVLIQDGLGLLTANFHPTQEQWDQMEVYRRQADQGLIGREEVTQHFARILNVSEKDIESIMSHLHKNVPVFQFVQQLKKAGYKTGLISNVSAGFVDKYFNQTEKNSFDCLLLSYTVGFTKPDPRIYQEACRRLQVEPERCVFIDDSKANVAGAEQVGMHGYVFDNLDNLKQHLTNLDVQFTG